MSRNIRNFITGKFGTAMPFVSRIKFIRSKLSIFLLMYPGSLNVSANRRVEKNGAPPGGASGCGGDKYCAFDTKSYFNISIACFELVVCGIFWI